MDRAIITLRQFLLVAGDLAVFYLALALAVWLRLRSGSGTLDFGDHLLPFSLIFAVWFLVFVLSGLYDLSRLRNRLTLINNLSAAMLAAAGLSVAFFYLVPGIGIAPKTTLFVDLVVSYLLLIGWRVLYLRVLGSRRLRRRILFAGLSEEARELIPLLRSRPLLGLDAVGAILLDGANAPGIPVRRTLEGFAQHLKEERVDTVALSLSPRTSPELTRHLYESIFLKVNFIDIISFYEQITQRVPISAITRVWFLENLQESTKRVYESAKRASDFLLACLIGVLTIALTPALSLSIWLDDRGPIFFSQSRVGKDGKIFRIKKFRTMVVDAESSGAQFAQKNDGRVTKVGRILRLTRLDELPQAWNVLKGDMAFVGPRPERPEFAGKLTTDMPYYPMRLLVRPGLTGWAQVNYPYYATPAEHRLKLQYDLYYVKNRSFILDMLIVLKTLNTVIRARGQ